MRKWQDFMITFGKHKGSTLGFIADQYPEYVEYIYTSDEEKFQAFQQAIQYIRAKQQNQKPPPPQEQQEEMPF